MLKAGELAFEVFNITPLRRFRRRSHALDKPRHLLLYCRGKIGPHPWHLFRRQDQLRRMLSVQAIDSAVLPHHSLH
jgi:hypothetical protein